MVDCKKEKKKKLGQIYKIDRSTFEVLDMDNPVFFSWSIFHSWTIVVNVCTDKNIKASLREYSENNDKVQLLIVKHICNLKK